MPPLKCENRNVSQSGLVPQWACWYVIKTDNAPPLPPPMPNPWRFICRLGIPKGLKALLVGGVLQGWRDCTFLPDGIRLPISGAGRKIIPHFFLIEINVVLCCEVEGASLWNMCSLCPGGVAQTSLAAFRVACACFYCHDTVQVWLIYLLICSSDAVLSVTGSECYGVI